MDQQAQATYVTAIPTTIIAVAAVYISYIQGRLEKRKAQRELFEKFNQRFDKINEDLNRVCKGESLIGLRTAEEIVQDYLNLCSEEYLSRTQGLVSKKVWSAWVEGINYYLQFEPVQAFFKTQSEVSPKSYYGFFGFIKSF